MSNNGKENPNNKIVNNAEFHGIDPIEFYDNIINLTSLKESCGKGGFSVEASEEGYNNYNKQKKIDSPVVGVVGNSNKGKSYILSKISNFKIPTGYSVTTKGICIKYVTINDTVVVVLDSAGSEAPLLGNDDLKLEENESEIKAVEKISDFARDKQATENFLQNFITFSSNVLLIVVGQLTYSDQKMINRIKRECWRQKTIFIIHNLMFLTKISEVQDFIKDKIITSITFGELVEAHYIDLKKKEDNNKNDNNNPVLNEKKDNSNDLYYTEIFETLEKREIKIVHLFMAQEGSEAGNYYNQSTIDYLRGQLIASTKVKKYDILANFKKYLYLSSGIYMEDEIKEESIEYNENERKFEIKSDKPIKLKKCFVDEIGTPNFYGNIIEPSYDYIIKSGEPNKELNREPNKELNGESNKEESNGELKVTLELPGKLINIDTKVQNVKGNYNFIYKGKIEFPDIQGCSLKNGNMKDGEFRLQFKIPISLGTLKSSKPEIKEDEKNGLCILTYKLSETNDDEETNVIDL